MTILVNNFDGGPDGTTITTSNSGQGENDAFNFTHSTNATLKFAKDNARPTAEFTAKMATSGTIAGSWVSWGSSIGTQSQIYLRMYVRYEAMPAAVDSIWTATSGGAVFCAWLGIHPTTHHLYIANSPQTALTDCSMPIIVGQWFRVECRIQFSTTTGNAELRYYEDPDSEDATDIVTVSNYNFGASSANEFFWGYIVQDSKLENLYLSGLELNNEGWPGPAPFKVKGVPGIQPSAIAIHNW
jgi:hypothetical protein